ncbi:hypothetical protein D3C71_1360300 [compost metagenome]
MRINARVHHRDQAVDNVAADTGIATRQAVDLQDHDQPHHGVIQGLAHARRVRAHQRTLQRFEVFARDLGGRQQAKARVDAIHRAALGDQPFNGRHAGVDGVRRARIQRQADRLLVDAPQVGQGEVAGFQVQFHFFLLRRCFGVLQWGGQAGRHAGACAASRVSRRANR